MKSIGPPDTLGKRVESSKLPHWHHLVLTVGYVGTNFHGYQAQGPEYSTVEGHFLQALQHAGITNMRNMGRAARTDKGVSAAANVITLDILAHATLSTSDLKARLQANLPSDIRIHHVWDMRTPTQQPAYQQTTDSAGRLVSDLPTSMHEQAASDRHVLPSAVGRHLHLESPLTHPTQQHTTNTATQAMSAADECLCHSLKQVVSAVEQKSHAPVHNIHARHDCTSRVYEYLVPLWALDPQARLTKLSPSHHVRGCKQPISSYLLTNNEVDRLQGILQQFVGRHSFHNLCKHGEAGSDRPWRDVLDFRISSLILPSHKHDSSFGEVSATNTVHSTIQHHESPADSKPPEFKQTVDRSISASCQRQELTMAEQLKHVPSLLCAGVQVIQSEDVSFTAGCCNPHVVLRLEGSSFMMHQIRKQVGLVLAVARGVAPIHCIAAALTPGYSITVPTAPAKWLLMEHAKYASARAKAVSPGPAQQPPNDASKNSPGTLEPQSTGWNSAAPESLAFKQRHIYPEICGSPHAEMWQCVAGLNEAAYHFSEWPNSAAAAQSNCIKQEPPYGNNSCQSDTSAYGAIHQKLRHVRASPAVFLGSQETYGNGKALWLTERKTRHSRS